MHSPFSYKQLITLTTVVFFFLAGNLTCFSQYNTAQAFTVKEEREYGRKMLTTIRRELPLINELDVTQYLNDLGQEVLDAAGPQYFTYHFYVIGNKELNAFAAPSGLIFIHSGLIEKVDNENELMSVIAHEVGHVMSRHIAGRSEKTPQMTAATLALVLAGIAVGAGPLSEALVMGGMATGQAMNLKYSREDEEEADREALELMRKMNRDPRDMLSMLKKMHRLYKIRMGNVPQYLLTHPVPQNRMNYVEDLINLYSAKGSRKNPEKFAFDRTRIRVEIITGDLERLEKEYGQALEDGGKQYEKMMARYGLALVFHKKGHYKDAINNLSKVGSLFSHPVIKTDLGRAYLDSGDIGTALKLFEEARSVEPGNMYNNYYLALALEKKGDFSRAEKLFQQVRAHVEDYPPVYKQIARISEKSGKKGDSHFYLGLHYFYAGDFAAGKFHLKKARTYLDKNDSKRKEIEKVLSGIDEYKS